MRRSHLPIVAVAALALVGAGYLAAKRVGELPGGGVVAATGQLIRPVGESLTVAGRPLDLVLSRDGKTLYAKDNRGVVVVDAGTWSLKQELKAEGGASAHGIALSPDGRTLYLTNAASHILTADVQPDGTLKWASKIELPKPKIGGDAYPCGLAMADDGKTALVCLSRNNSLGVVDLTAGATKEIPVGISPFDVVIASGKAFVSNWGGEKPEAGEKTAPSAGTQVEVDERGIGKSGTVSVVDLAAGKETKQIDVGLQPSDLALSPDGTTLCVTNSNSDTVDRIDVATARKVGSVNVRPDPALPYGSAPNGVAWSADGKTLYVANGGNNAIGVYGVAAGKMRGWIPAGWYPGAVLAAGDNLYVANVKGWGSRGKQEKPGERSVYQFSGTLQKLAVPGESELKRFTAQVLKDGLTPQALLALERSNAKVKPVPIPAKLGEPSTIEHVFYVIKENRTYDQMLGDMKQADGEPQLCMFPREVTPNHHALAEQFVLLDNYYCNGVNSADGHAWSVEGEASTYLERSFGGFTRSYPFGDDPLTPCSSGFIWDNVLAAGLSFRNFGEFDYAEPEDGKRTFKQIHDDFIAGKRETFKQNIGIDRLRNYSSRDFPGWNMKIPDILRAERFIREFKGWGSDKPWPHLTIITLPQDHNSGLAAGMPTPRAHTADNDLALGRIVQAISNSRLWAKTAIFVIEDDPQNGFDHVDGHRSLCLVASPYARRGKVISEFYNQSSVLHTMERILGLRPMNQMDASGALMTACFTPKPDLKPYNALPNRIRLDELNPPATAFQGLGRRLAEASARQNYEQPDRVDDMLMNRATWYSVKGAAPYPRAARNTKIRR